MTRDNSSVENFTKCPRKYQYKVIQKRESNEFRAGMNFGSIIHKCLDIKYRGLGDIKALQQRTLEEFYLNAGFAPDDYRNLNYAVDLLAAYDAAYPVEPFHVLSPVEQNIEVAFHMPLGPHFWEGRIDLNVQYPDERIWVTDHKTSSMGGSSFFDEYLNSQPQVGYVVAAEYLLKRPVSGFIINAIFCRAKTKTGKGVGFERQIFTVTDEMKAEWKENTLQVLEDISRAEAIDRYPQYKTACSGKYGSCEYLPVCSQCKSSRPVMLASNLYKDVTWSPFNVEA